MPAALVPIKGFCGANSTCTADLCLGTRLMPTAIIMQHCTCKNGKIVKGDISYSHKITTIQSFRSILSLNTEYLSIGSLNPQGI
jgi:hypothetical protein